MKVIPFREPRRFAKFLDEERDGIVRLAPRLFVQFLFDEPKQCSRLAESVFMTIFRFARAN